MRALVREPRIIAGVALMLIATLGAGLFLQHAARRTSVWQVSRSLAAGTVLAPGDVHVTEVALDAVDAYAGARDVVLGRALARDAAAGELLATAALVAPMTATHTVSVPVDRLHAAPALRHGQRVDVWWSNRPQQDEPVRSRRVLSAVLVDGVAESEVGGAGAVVLTLPEDRVPTLVQALRSGDIDLVRVGGRG